MPVCGAPIRARRSLVGLTAGFSWKWMGGMVGFKSVKGPRPGPFSWLVRPHSGHNDQQATGHGQMECLLSYSRQNGSLLNDRVEC